jgi:hypothetical protein
MACVGLYRDIMVTMAENVEKATRPQLQELIQLLIEEVQAKERSVEPTSIAWTPRCAHSSRKVRCHGAPGRALGALNQTASDEMLVAYA